MSLLCLLLAFEARAHLAFPNFHSIKTTVTANDEGVYVLAAVEIPLADLVIAFNQHFEHLDLIAEIQAGKIGKLEQEFRIATFERLAKGLSLSVDGEDMTPTAWQPVVTPFNGRAGEAFFVYLLEAYVDSRPREMEIEVVNRLFDDQDLVLANLAQVSHGWRVASSSSPQPPPEADLTEGSEDELALWSDDANKRRYTLRLEPE
ncbi:MAG: hypothetical protein AAGA81_19990 [Acidobacteriota bacterium]